MQITRGARLPDLRRGLLSDWGPGLRSKRLPAVGYPDGGESQSISVRVTLSGSRSRGEFKRKEKGRTSKTLPQQAGATT